jgi:diguanylate cyclase (GGDEF)-like protein
VAGALMCGNMGVYRASRGVRRVVLVAFATIALVLIGLALALVAAGPAQLWLVAAVGVICAAALEVCWLRVGSIPHRSPVISLPVFALAVLSEAATPVIATGVISLGVLLIIFIRTRRPPVALYSAGLAGAGSVLSVLVFEGLHGAGVAAFLAAAAASAAYVVFIVVAETIRMAEARPASRRVAWSLLSPVRFAAVTLATATLSSLTVFINESGLAFGSDKRQSALVVLLTLTLIAVGIKLASSIRAMRHRLTGLISGAGAIGQAGRAEVPGGSLMPTAEADATATALIAGMLRAAVDTTLGTQSVEVRDLPPRRGELGASVTLVKGEDQFVIAHRDAMDTPFTADDLSALEALARSANVAMRAHYNIGGLTARANTDPLTGLPNYGAFQEALANINDHRDYSEALAVLFLDLDDFKRMNDRHGHQAGDEILRELGRRLRAVVRPRDVVARVGGDEFVVILTHLSSLGEAKVIAERILAVSAEPLAVGAVTHIPVLSIGLAYSAHRETDVNQLVQDADRSMLAIKKSRRRGGPANESSINISSHRSSQMNDIIAQAIDQDLLELAFQPVVSLVTGQIWAFEALVRYTHPDLGPLSPPSIVEKAKGLGRLDAMTRQVALKAMAAAADFRLVEPRVVCMTINVEAGQILPERVGTFLEDLAHRYPGISLCLELNERSMSKVTPAIRAQADRMRDLGMMIALDDYGSQDSSVDALVRMPMDILKIDRSLVDDLDDIRQREVLTALQGFGDNLEYSMIVEGVENEAMATHLIALGIRSAQGFHYGVPESFERTLSRLELHGARAVVPRNVPVAERVNAGLVAAAIVAAAAIAVAAPGEPVADATGADALDSVPQG